MLMGVSKLRNDSCGNARAFYARRSRLHGRVQQHPQVWPPQRCVEIWSVFDRPNQIFDHVGEHPLPTFADIHPFVGRGRPAKERRTSRRKVRVGEGEGCVEGLRKVLSPTNDLTAGNACPDEFGHHEQADQVEEAKPSWIFCPVEGSWTLRPTSNGLGTALDELGDFDDVVDAETYVRCASAPARSAQVFPLGLTVAMLSNEG